MCGMLRVHFSDCYAWSKEPVSRRAKDDLRQCHLVRQARTDSGEVEGYRKVTHQLRHLTENGSEKRMVRLSDKRRGSSSD